MIGDGGRRASFRGACIVIGILRYVIIIKRTDMITLFVFCTITNDRNK